jgi:glycosyltransferase involved in cell wall biosynthesis
MRLAVCQLYVPEYRVPVFEMLGRQADLDVTVFAGPSPAVANAAPDERAHFKLREAPLRPVRWLPGGFQWQDAQLKAVDPSSFDCAFLSWSAWYASLGPALRRARRCGVPVVLWGHGHSKTPSALRDWMRHRLGRRARGVMVYTNSWAERLVAEHGYDRQRVFVAQNAIDQAPVQAARQHWEQDDGRLEAFQQEHGLDPRRTLIFVSRLIRDNQVGRMIDAMSLLASRRPDVRLVIVGDGPARAELEQQARERGVGDAVRFVGAIFDDEQLAPWMLSASIFAYPVNIGLSLMHAFGYGLPVVTSNDLERHGPESEALVPEQNGLMYEDGDVESMIECWLRILDDDALRSRMSACALSTVTDKYTLRAMVQGMLDALTIVDGVKRQVG